MAGVSTSTQILEVVGDKLCLDPISLFFRPFSRLFSVWTYFVDAAIVVEKGFSSSSPFHASFSCGDSVFSNEIKFCLNSNFEGYTSKTKITFVIVFGESICYKVFFFKNIIRVCLIMILRSVLNLKGVFEKIYAFW